MRKLRFETLGSSGESMATARWLGDEVVVGACGLDFSSVDLDFSFLFAAMTVLTGGTLLIEISMSNLEALLQQHHHYLRILRKLYKEIVLLGISAMLLMPIRQFAPFTSNQFNQMELCQLWLSCMGFSIVSQSIIMMRLMRNVKQEWDDVLLEGPQHLLEQYDLMERPRAHSDFIRRLYGKNTILEGMELFLCNDLMIKRYKLPAQFDFVKYARRTLSVSLTDGIQVSNSSFILLATILTISSLTIFWGSPNLSAEVSAALILWLGHGISWLLVVVCLVVIYYLEKSRDNLLREGGCSNIKFLPNDFRLLNNSAGKMALTLSEDDPNDYESVNPEVLLEKSKQVNKELASCFPRKNPKLLQSLFDLILLVQNFILGLVIIGSLNFDSLTPLPNYVVLIIGIVPHVIIVMNFFPRIFRSFTILHSVCRLNSEKAHIIANLLIDQEATQGLVVRFGLSLCDLLVDGVTEFFNNGMYLAEPHPKRQHRGFQNPKLTKVDREHMQQELLELYNHMARDMLGYTGFYNRIRKTVKLENSKHDTEAVTVAINSTIQLIFDHFDFHHKGHANIQDIVQVIREEPFNIRISAKQGRHLVRALGCQTGFRREKFGFIVAKVFQGRVHIGKQRVSPIDLCFRTMNVPRCGICDQPVNIAAMERHAETCAPEELISGSLEQLKEDELMDYIKTVASKDSECTKDDDLKLVLDITGE